MVTPGLAERVAALTGRQPVGWWAPTGGYTRALRFVVRFGDGSSAFVKAAVDEQTGAWLRAELAVYDALFMPYLPHVLGVEREPPLLLLEDLSGADWPPPWTAERVVRVRAALADVAATSPPPFLPPLAALREELSGWRRVAADPAPFLSLDLADGRFLDRALPALLHAEASAVLDGDELVHVDVRSDNLCFTGDRTLLVDWNWAARGNAEVDLAAWLPSLAAEGGPPPEHVAAVDPALAALVAGYFASKAGLPPPAPGSTVRAVQQAQLAVALPWACRLLGIAQAPSSTGTSTSDPYSVHEPS